MPTLNDEDRQPSPYQSLLDEVGAVKARLADLATEAMPAALSLATTLSSLDAIKLELQNLVAAVDRLIAARDLADLVIQASGRLGRRKP